MYNLIIFILVSISITNIIQNESIFSWLRSLINKVSLKIYSFITCPVCFGFWVGIALSFFFNFHENLFINICFSGLISSIVNKLYAIFTPENFNIE